MANVTIDLFSFFSGAGLLDLGFEFEDYHVVYANEIHEPFAAAYRYARTNLSIQPPLYGYDVCSISTVLSEPKRRQRLFECISASKHQGRLVGFIGGPPCPDFSVGGKNRGHLGDNGILSRSYIDAIQAFQPDFFLFENVLGLWRTAKHRAFFEELKSYLALSGYVMSQQLINAIQYGVPQDRDRIILFGVKRHLVASSMVEDEGSPGYLATGVIPWPVFTKYPGRTAFDYPWPKTVPFAEDSCLPQPQGIPLELTVEYWFRQNRVSQHANSIRCFRPRATFKRFITIAEGDVSKKSFKRLHRWRYSPTASYGNNEVHIHPYKPRRISAAEALAIQSLPSDFVLPDDMSLSNMFKAIGNGVPFLASRGIARTIRSFLEGLG